MASPKNGSENVHTLKARSVIEDAFRRADKDDDGALSLQEFQNYFDDPIMSSDELKELFHKIDTHNSNNIDVSELCEYFTQYWLPFESVFATVDDLSTSVTHSLHTIAKDINQKSRIEKFATRFFIKEISHHTSAVEKALEVAIDTLEEGEETARESVVIQSAIPPANKPRWQQKVERSLSSRSTESDTNVSGTALSKEICRLSSLIDKLENKIVLTPVEEEVVSNRKVKTVLIVSYNMECVEEETEKFCDILKGYVQALQLHPDCYHVGIRRIADSSLFTVYEVWKSDECWNNFVKKKSIEVVLEGLLKKQLEKQSLCIPDSWWPSMV